MRNCCITISEIEVVFRRADFRCSRSLYSMLLYKNRIGFKFSINIFRTKRMIHVHYVSTRWFVVSLLTGYLSELGFSRYTFSRNDGLNRHNVWLFTSCAEDKTVSSVNADIRAESCSVGQEHPSSFTKFSQSLLYCRRISFDQQFVHK